MKLNHPFSERSIPILENPPTTSLLAEVGFDPSDNRYEEPLVDLTEFGLKGRNYYSQNDGENPPYRQKLIGSTELLFARASVAEMLACVNQELLRHDIELWIYDAYRPVSTQQGLWQFFRDRIKDQSPKLSNQELDDEVRKYVSDPRKFKATDPRTWPLHSTGGAVDVVLKRKNATDLPYYGAPFDDMTDASHTDYFERQLLNGAIEPEDERLVNRRILYWAMRQAGFTNYPYEYWHFDWGNQMHILTLDALGLKAPKLAWYGYVPTPE